ncbi:unnamed protein product [Phytomonas sp. Hart1]|nr:unnamed protein product [Phytomonas sp. Hart1]|eukprot:CCW67578.1 unnamed protein product [Phytomonas sp. isolate Hart1]
MLKATGYRFLSLKWRLHSEQLKQWIALTTFKGMQLARTYMHNLNLDEAIEEMDDCCELVGLMQECGYPTGGRHDHWIRSFIVMNADSIGPQLIVDITKRLETHPNTFSRFRSTFFSEPNFISRMKYNITALSPDDFASFAHTFLGLAYGSHDLYSDLEPLTYSFSSAVSASLRDASNPFTLMLSLAECNLLLSHNSLKELSVELSIASKKLSREEIRLLIGHISTHGQQKHNSWVIDLQQSYFSEPLFDYERKEVVYLMKMLAYMKTEPIPQIVQCIIASIPHLPGSELLSLARSIHQYSLDIQKQTGLTDVLDSVKNTLNIDMASKISNFEEGAQLIACLSQLNFPETRQLLLDLLLCCDLSMITTKGIANTCIAMNSLDHYPVEAAILCKADLNLSTIDQDEVIHILHAFVQLKSTVDRTLVKKAHGKFSKRAFTQRKREHQTKLDVYRDSLILLVISLVYLHGNEELKELKGIALDLLDKNLFDKDEKFFILSKLKDGDVSCYDVKKYVVMDLISSIADNFSSFEYQLILETLSDLGIRDANAFVKVLKHLKRTKSSIQNILCAAKAAHKLQLIPQFEASNISEAFDSLSECGTEDVFLLMRLCTPIQRTKIIENPRIQDILNHVDLNSISTSDLFIMFNLSLSQREGPILDQLVLRAPLKETDIDAEEVIIAMEKLQSSTLMDKFEGVFRVGSRALQKVNEGQLTRLFNCIKDLAKGPNIVYRVIGSVLLKMVDKISVDCVMMWLLLYFEARIRDNSVGRALAKKALRHSVFLSKESAKKLQRAAEFYGLTRETQVHNRMKRNQPFIDNPLNF